MFSCFSCMRKCEIWFKMWIWFVYFYLKLDKINVIYVKEMGETSVIWGIVVKCGIMPFQKENERVRCLLHLS